MTSDSADRFQFACDYDGDLHLFPKNLDEPDLIPFFIPVVPLNCPHFLYHVLCEAGEQ